MSPIQILSRLFKVSPTIAAFIFAGMGVFAAAAIVLSLGSDISDLSVVAIYLVVLAAIATVLAFILNDGLMRATICWICITAFGGWTVGLFDSALQLSGRLPSLPCYIRLPVSHPEECMARFAPTVAEIGGPQQDTLDLPGVDGPETLWFAQLVTEPPIPHADPTIAQTGKVYLHFTPDVQQDEVKALSENLSALNWPIPEGQAGGELVTNGPKSNEVRYFHPADNEGAVALAETLYALSPDTPVSVRDFSRLGSFVPDGQFEIWVNALSLQERLVH